ncbi:MAG: DoxX family protein [Gemmatimonadales bacterium]
MWQKLIRTDGEIAPMIARLVLGVVIFPHAAQKVFGWFGGPGFSGTMGFFAGMGIPAAFGLLAIVAECLGSLGLITGLLSRVAAFGISCIMLVAIATVHFGNGFFMNWFGTQKGEGFEYHLLALGLAAIVMVRGGGAHSVDGMLSEKQ